MRTLIKSGIQTDFFSRLVLGRVGLLEREGRRVRYMTGGVPLLGAGVIRAVGRGAIGAGVGGVIGRLEGLPTGLLEGGLYTDPTGAASVYVA